MDRISVLIGAGATIDIGGPTTDELTEKVCQKKQLLFKGKSAILKSVAKQLNDYYNPNKINFEHLMHAIEMLDTYRDGWNNPGNLKYKPPIIPFIKPRFTRYFKDNSIGLLVAKQDIIRTIADEVNKYDHKFRKTKKYDWYKDFWGNSGLIWDITTLNYDTTIEYSLNNEYEDGFEDISDNYFRFNPLKLENPSKSTLTHIHGCINFGYPRNIQNKYAYEDTHEDIYKLNSYKEAKQTWFGRSTHRTQAAEETIIGPIITGLRKVEKLNTYPYSHYLYNFQKSILKNKSLLIVGYGLGDLYLNQLMERLNRIHGEKKKIVIITFYGKDDWTDDHRIIDFPETNDGYLFLAKAFVKESPLKGYKRENFINKEPIRSEKGNVLVYLHGFKEAIQNHKNEILDFFNK
jgi:SIR2-like domain